MDLMFLHLDAHLQRLRDLEASAVSYTLNQIERRFVAGWIFHDLSIEGWVFRDNELQRALEGREGTSWLEMQLFDKVQKVRRGIHFINNEARLRSSFELELIKEIHRHLCDRNDDTAGRYRKVSGETRVYRHDMMPPSSISYRLRRLVAYVQTEADFLHPIVAGCEIHKRLIDIFPFQSDNGIVARLAMNFWLLRHGYPPAVFYIHQRQRYFDTYLSSNGTFQKFVIDSIRMVAEARIKSLDGLLMEADRGLEG